MWDADNDATWRHNASLGKQKHVTMTSYDTKRAKSVLEVTVKYMRRIKIRKSGSIVDFNKIDGIIGDPSYCVAAYTLQSRS